MKKKSVSKIAAACLSLTIVLVLLFNSFVSVYDGSYVYIRRFDRVIRVYDEPGLVFLIPFVDTARELPGNIISFDLMPRDMLTMDKITVQAFTYAVFRISDPLKFLRSAESIDRVKLSLDAYVFSSVRNLAGAAEWADFIGYNGLARSVKEDIRGPMLANYGIDVLDIQIMHLGMSAENKEAVYARMISERERIESAYRAAGLEEAGKIRNSAVHDAAALISQAQAQAQVLIGEGELEYMRIMAEVLDSAERAEFYIFIRSLDALRTSLQGDATVNLPLDSPLMRWLLFE